MDNEIYCVERAVMEVSRLSVSTVCQPLLVYSICLHVQLYMINNKQIRPLFYSILVIEIQ